MYNGGAGTEGPVGERAGSHFSRFTLSVTQEDSGRVSWRLQGKEHQDQWQELRTVSCGTLFLHEPIIDADNVASVLMGILQSQLSAFDALVE